MRFLFQTRASALALTLAVGATLGLVFSGVCLAGDAPSRPEKVYAVAAQTGYAQAAAAPSAGAVTAESPFHVAVKPITVVESRPAATPGALDCLAAAVYYEARGESVAGRAAVAQVVLNRTRRAGYPRSVCAVVFQGEKRGECQFSFVCNGAMHGRREPSAWGDAHRVAARALGGYVMAMVGNATSFHSAEGRAPRGAIRLGGHVFFT